MGGGAKGVWGRITSSDRARMPERGTLRWHAWRVIQEANTRVYRLTRGRVGGRLDRAPVLILHHVGRRSGERRQTPVLYLRDGEDLVLVASTGGSPKHPAWYHNLMAAPDVQVEIRDRRLEVRARRAGPEERERLWPRLLEMWPAWEDYTTRTDREFPVVILSPR